MALSHPLVVALIGIAVLALWRSDARRPPYLLWFGLAYLAYSCGVTSQILLVPANHALNVIFSGAMYLSAATAFAQGIIALSGEANRYGAPAVIVLLGIACRIYFLLIEESSSMRLYCLHGTVCLLFLHAAWAARGLRKGLMAEKVAYYAFILFTLTTPPRTLLMWLRTPGSYGFDLSTYWVITKISIYAFSLVFGLALIITIIQRSSRTKQIIDENLSLISHDLRAPLATIFGNLRLLQKTASLEQRTQMRAIERSAKYQDSLIGDILAGKEQNFELLEVNSSFIKIRRLLADLCLHADSWCSQHNTVFSLGVLTPLPDQIRTDERRLKQVLLNLLSNAALATRDGNVQLHVKTLIDKPGWVRIRFEVHDTGPGIDACQQSRLFNAHERFNTQQPGTGLGLYIAQRITNNLGGLLAVHSEPGKGSCFSFELGAPTRDDGAIPSGWQPPSSPAKVLADPFGHRHCLPSKESRQQLAKYASEGRYSEIEHWIRLEIPAKPGYQGFRSVLQKALDRLDFDEIYVLARSHEQAPQVE